jgi:hypothetical protein
MVHHSRDLDFSRTYGARRKSRSFLQGQVGQAALPADSVLVLKADRLPFPGEIVPDLSCRSARNGRRACLRSGAREERDKLTRVSLDPGFEYTCHHYLVERDP